MAISRNAGLMINAGDPIAQVVFQRLDEPTVLPYDGKYQDAPPGPAAGDFRGGLTVTADELVRTLAMLLAAQ